MSYCVRFTKKLLVTAVEHSFAFVRQGLKTDLIRKGKRVKTSITDSFHCYSIRVFDIFAHCVMIRDFGLIFA